MIAGLAVVVEDTTPGIMVEDVVEMAVAVVV